MVSSICFSLFLIKSLVKQEINNSYLIVISHYYEALVFNNLKKLAFKIEQDNRHL